MKLPPDTSVLTAETFAIRQALLEVINKKMENAVIQCVWLILSRKFSSSPAGEKLRVWRQASRAGGGVFTEVIPR